MKTENTTTPTPEPTPEPIETRTFVVPYRDAEIVVDSMISSGWKATGYEVIGDGTNRLHFERVIPQSKG